jgi:pyrimidine operon attenuation protein / uracil phosphoribosyltransferase
MNTQQIQRQAVTILDKDGMRRALTRIAHEILEHNGGPEGLALAGVRTRGVPLARRLADLITQFEGVDVPVYELDATPYRDDRDLWGNGADALRAERRPPESGGRSLDQKADVRGLSIVLVDDVLYTGRTVRAAVDALMAMGRPAGIQLAVLVDRGHRELPIRADYVGKNVPTSRTERIHVRLLETDDVDEVILKRET